MTTRVDMFDEGDHVRHGGAVHAFQATWGSFYVMRCGLQMLWSYPSFQIAPALLDVDVVTCVGCLAEEVPDAAPAP